MRTEPLVLQNITLGSSRISVFAQLPPSAPTWGRAELAELRESGACGAVVGDPQVYTRLNPWAQEWGIPLLWDNRTGSLPSGLEVPAALVGCELPGTPGLPFFHLSREPRPGYCFFDTGFQFTRYPAWTKELTFPWGPTLGDLSLEEGIPLALAAVAAGAQILLVQIQSPQDLEPLVGELKGLALALGRELTRIPKKTVAAAGPSQPTSPKLKAAFQGEHGAYSEMAVYSVFDPSQAQAVPTKTFREVYSAVLAGEVDYGVLPIENALAGPIQDNFDLLKEFPDLHIIAETQVRIEHNLIGLPGASLSQIRKVLSHPQGLAQSRVFIDAHPGWEAVPFYDTAGSVAHIAQLKDPSLAAIASAEAARFYGMEILAPGIETNRQNFTRFFVLAPLAHGPLGKANKASILFSTADEPGALSRCLAIFASHGVNMKKLESRPIHGRPWEYMFYVDVQLPPDLSAFDNALAELKNVAQECRLLGRYRA